MDFGQRRVNALSVKRKMSPSLASKTAFCCQYYFFLSFFLLNIYLFLFGLIGFQLRHSRPFVAAHGLSPECPCSAALVYGLSCSRTCGILVPQPGMEPRSPALQCEFLTTDHQGSPSIVSSFT